MGVFANRAWVEIVAWTIAAVIVALNLKLVFDVLAGWFVGRPLWTWAIILIPLGMVLVVLVRITAGPFLRPGRRWELRWIDGVLSKA